MATRTYTFCHPQRWKGLFDAPRQAAAERGGGGGGPFTYTPGGLHLGLPEGLEHLLNLVRLELY